MKNNIKIVDREIGHVIEIERTASTLKMPKIMGQDYNTLFRFLNENGVEPSNKTMPYTRYIDVDWKSQMAKGVLANFVDAFTKKWHFFDGIQTPKALENRNELVSSNFAKRKYLWSMHYGPYHKVSETYKKMWKFAEENNLNLANESFEFYLNDPKTVSKDQIETEALISIIE